MLRAEEGEILTQEEYEELLDGQHPAGGLSTPGNADAKDKQGDHY